MLLDSLNAHKLITWHVITIYQLLNIHRAIRLNNTLW